jgi:multidrug efflux system outer membrane protein
VFTAMIDVYKATGGGWVSEADKLTATVSEKRP